MDLRRTRGALLLSTGPQKCLRILQTDVREWGDNADIWIGKKINGHKSGIVNGALVNGDEFIFIVALNAFSTLMDPRRKFL